MRSQARYSPPAADGHDWHGIGWAGLLFLLLLASAFDWTRL